MDQPIEILVISSELGHRRTLVDILQRNRWRAVCASAVSECHELFATRNITLVFCDRQLPDGTYRDVLKTMRSLNTNVPLVVTSRVADWDEYVAASCEGAFDLIASPCGPSDVTWMILRARCEKGLAALPGKTRGDIPVPEAIRTEAEIRIDGVDGDLRTKAGSA